MKILALDSTMGGLGDIWMRLTALYSLAALNSCVFIKLSIPKHLLAVAKIAFPDRLELDTIPFKGAYEFNHLGLRHLLPKIMQGERFACPFTRILQTERKHTKAKDVLNDALFTLVSATRRIKQPTVSSVRTYQGFHELSMFPELRASYPEFVTQTKHDALEIQKRLHLHWPKCNPPEFDILVFPGGSAHQIMPPAWAKANLPKATFAFFAGDPFQLEFEALGLTTQNFKSTEDLILLIAAAGWILVTDSFPSHVAQSYTASATLMLTEQVPPRTIYPAFEGSVVQTAAPCAPCKHIVRGFSRCEAGHDFCTTWSDKKYTKELLATVA
jgi:hypothetical protein